MAVRDVLVYPHPALKQVARALRLPVAGGEWHASGSELPAGDPVTGAGGRDSRAGSPERELADAELAVRVGVDLLDTMRAHPGCVGVAAPQLDEPVRMIVVDVSEHRRTTRCHGLLVLANPVLVRAEGAEVAREGCLSIPELTANVRRATHILLSAVTPAGERVEIETEGFEARCLLHEVDHLDGVLFLDRVDSLSADVFRRKSYR